MHGAPQSRRYTIRVHNTRCTARPNRRYTIHTHDTQFTAIPTPSHNSKHKHDTRCTCDSKIRLETVFTAFTGSDKHKAQCTMHSSTQKTGCWYTTQSVGTRQSNTQCKPYVTALPKCKLQRKDESAESRDNLARLRSVLEERSGERSRSLR